MTESEGFASFFTKVGDLKQVDRTGWVDREIPLLEVESVADHSFRMALIAWLAAGEVPEMDRERVVILALVHDLAEAITGDHPPYDREAFLQMDPQERLELMERRQLRSPETKAAKRAAERAAILELVADLPAVRQTELLDLWNELDSQQTREARFVKQVDALETWLQSQEYRDRYPDLPVQSFDAEINEVLEVPVLQQIRDSARTLRGVR